MILTPLFTALESALKAVVTIRRAEKLATSLLGSSEQLPADYALSANHFSRTRQYIRYFSLLENAICLLHGHTSERKEREAFIFLSACGPLFDDLFDRSLAGCDDILRVTRSLQTNPEDDPLLRQYAIFLRDILERIVMRDLFLQTSGLLCMAQEAAATFKQGEMPDELLKNTRLKGGYTAMLCRYTVDIPLVDYEKELFMQLGYLSQLTDDLFDFPADLNQMHITPVLACTGLDQVRELYEEGWNQFDELLQSLPIAGHRKEDFRKSLLLPRAVFYVGYEHFKKLGVASLSGNGNNTMIPACDMETPGKQWSLLLKIIHAAKYSGGTPR
ncbi:MAG: class 1 isoprenoid biosynthesis enzyme [Bacteroidales bacterium]